MSSASVPLHVGTTTPPSITLIHNEHSSGQSLWRQDCRAVQVGLMKAKPCAPLSSCYKVCVCVWGVSHNHHGGSPSLNDVPFYVINPFWARAEPRSRVMKRQQVNPKAVPMPLQG